MRSWLAGIVLLGSVVWALGLGVPPDVRAQQVKKPSQLYLLRAVVSDGDAKDLDGPAGPFSVPKGRVFVIRSINIFPITEGAGQISLVLEQGPDTVTGWNVPMDAPTFIPYPAGFRLAGGGDKVLRIVNPPASDGAVEVEVNGILYKDK